MSFLKTKPILFLMLALWLVASCAPKPKQAKTKLNITPSLAIANINMDGGAIVYGQQTDGPGSWGKIFRPGQDVFVDMAFGTWNFSVFSFAGPAPLEGAKECAFLNNINIERENEVVDMVVNTANCAGAGIRRINIKRCSDSEYTSADPVANCSQTTGFQSYKLVLLSHRLGQPTGDMLSTACLKDSAGNFDTTGRPILPVGATNVRTMPFEIITFNGANCDPGTENYFSVDRLYRPVGGQIFKTVLNATDLYIAVNNARFPLTRTLTGVSPTTGGLAGGYNLLVNGTNLDPAGTITVGGNNCPIVSGTAASLTCTMPAGTLGTADVIHTTLGGDSVTLANAFTYANAPSITGVSPAVSPTAGGTLLTITGTNFQAGATVTANGFVCTSPTVSSATTITCTTSAAGASVGSVIVANPDSQTGSFPFYYEDTPTITSITPTNVNPAGGTTIMVTGTNFSNGAVVSIGGSNNCASTSYVSSTQIQCDATPAGPSGVYSVDVTNPGGTSATLANAITYNPAPTLTSVTPSTGLISGGTSVTINGANFQTGTTVNIGGVACTTPTVTSTTITCTTGANSAGLKSVTILSPDGQVVNFTNQFTYQNPANISISGTDPVNFGSLTTGSSGSLTFTLTNGGDVAATAITESGLAAPFNFTGGSYPGTGGTCGATLAAGANCTIEVAFTPSVSGVSNDTILIDYNDGSGATQSARSVNGTGLTPASLTINGGVLYDFHVVPAYPIVPTSYQGTYDAASDTPSLTNASGTNGQYYSVTSAGTKDFGTGPLTMNANSIIVHDGAKWIPGPAIAKATLTVQNTGETPATAVAFAGPFTDDFRFPNNAGFPGFGGSCTTTIAPGASCNVIIEIPSNQIKKHLSNFQIDYNDGLSTVSSSINLQAKTGKIVKISGGQNSKCALFDIGKVKCWGNNNNGQLGYGDISHRGDAPLEMGVNLPIVDLGTNYFAKDIASGWHHHCALLEGGNIKCWGRNHLGQLGYGDTVDRGINASEMGDNLQVIGLPSGQSAKRIAAGNFNTCAVLDNASEDLICWGDGSFGQNGQGDTKDLGGNTPNLPLFIAPIPLGANPKPQVTIGDGFICASTAINDIKCWGRNNSGQLGRENVTDILDPATLVTGIDLTITGPVPVAGGAHVCARGQQQLQCWGSNADGQLGKDSTVNIGDTTNSLGVNLTSISLPGNILQHGATGNISCAKNDSDDVYCFGYNFYGAMGNGTTANVGDNPGEISGIIPIDLGSTPGDVPSLLSENATCAILANGEAKCWGENNFGALGLGDTNHRGDNPGEMGDTLPYIELH